MPRAASSKIDKIEHPQSHHATPDELIEDRPLSFEEKCNALKVWEQDARQIARHRRTGAVALIMNPSSAAPPL